MLPLLLRSARFMRNAPAANFLARNSLAHSLSPRQSLLHTLAIANSSMPACKRMHTPPMSMAMKMQQLCTSSKPSEKAASEADSKPDSEAEQPGAAEAAAGEAAGGSSASAADLEKQLAVMEEEMRMLKEDNQEKHDQLLRALADAENARRRAVVDVENANKFAVSKFAKDLLDVADNLGRAAESVPEAMRSSEDHKELSALYTGVELTEHVLLKTFEKYGLKKITPLGEKFDPNFHNAMFEVPDPEKEVGTVAMVVSAGFIHHDRCLRPAGVGVVSKPPE